VLNFKLEKAKKFANTTYDINRKIYHIFLYVSNN